MKPSASTSLHLGNCQETCNVGDKLRPISINYPPPPKNTAACNYVKNVRQALAYRCQSVALDFANIVSLNNLLQLGILSVTCVTFSIHFASPPIKHGFFSVLFTFVLFAFALDSFT